MSTRREAEILKRTRTKYAREFEAAFYAEGGGRWVTIGAHKTTGKDGREKGHGGTPVHVGEDGKIDKGPAGMKGNSPETPKGKKDKPKDKPKEARKRKRVVEEGESPSKQELQKRGKRELQKRKIEAEETLEDSLRYARLMASDDDWSGYRGAQVEAMEAWRTLNSQGDTRKNPADELHEIWERKGKEEAPKDKPKESKADYPGMTDTARDTLGEILERISPGGANPPPKPLPFEIDHSDLAAAIDIVQGGPRSTRSFNRINQNPSALNTGAGAALRAILSGVVSRDDIDAKQAAGPPRDGSTVVHESKPATEKQTRFVDILADQAGFRFTSQAVKDSIGRVPIGGLNRRDASRVIDVLKAKIAEQRKTKRGQR